MSGVVVSDGLHSQFTQVELRVLKNKVIFLNCSFFFPFKQFSILGSDDMFWTRILFDFVGLFAHWVPVI